MKKTEIGDILKEHNIDNPLEMSDEELLDIQGVGPATLEKIRNAKVISKKFLHLGGGYNVTPGAEIPPEYDPVQYVERGQAEWQ